MTGSPDARRPQPAAQAEDPAAGARPGAPPAGELAGRRLLIRPLVEADAEPLLEAVSASRAQLKRRFGWVESAVGVEDMARFIRARARAFGEGSAATFAVVDARSQAAPQGVAGRRAEVQSRPQAAAQDKPAPAQPRPQRLLGVISLDRIRRDTLRAELSLWVRGDEQDKGYAVEAGRLAVEYAFKRLNLHRLYSRIDPANRAARKVLQRLGFRYEGCLRADKRLNARWVDQECWGMLRGDWKK